MGRLPRPVADGLTYHVTARGNAKGLIFLDDRDRRNFRDGLDGLCRRYGWRCLSYFLMGNHFHLALTTPRGNLPHGMRDLMGRYAWSFNRRHGRRDHLFGRRHFSVVVETDEQLLAVVRYIARNPTRGGLATTPRDWPWSGYPAILGLAPAPRFLDVEDLLKRLDPDPARARIALAGFVETTAKTLPAARLLQNAVVASARAALPLADDAPSRSAGRGGGDARGRRDR